MRDRYSLPFKGVRRQRPIRGIGRRAERAGAKLWAGWGVMTGALLSKAGATTPSARPRRTFAIKRQDRRYVFFAGWGRVNRSVSSVEPAASKA
jgi:hypothetical protein